MLAGDIRIGNDFIIGTGDIFLVCFVLVGYGIAYAVLLVYQWRKVRSKLQIWAAKRLRLTEDVTLGEGVDAYFYGDCQWEAGPDDMVDILAGPWCGPTGHLRVHLRTGEIEIFAFLPEKGAESTPSALIGALIQAAKNKATYSAADKKTAAR